MPLDRTIVLCALVLIFLSACCAISETDRVRVWNQKHAWPPMWHPESDIYKERAFQREAEVCAVMSERIHCYMVVCFCIPFR